MRYLLSTIIFLTFTLTVFADNTKHYTDSLLNQLNKTHSPEKRIPIYRNLADIYSESPQEKTYLLKMYEEAKKVNNRTIMLSALNDIVICEAKSCKKDSIVKYINYIKKTATLDEIKRMLPFYHMRFLDALCYLNKSGEAINEELAFLDSNSNKDNDIYRQVALDYVTGNSLYVNEEFEKSISYLEKAMKQTNSFPEKERYIYQKFITWRLCYAYAQSGKGKEAVPIMENMIGRIEQDYKVNYQKQRPFYNIEAFLLQYYTFMISSLPYLTVKQETYYWKRIQEISKHLTNPADIYNFYLSANNYYSNNRTKIDLPKAIAANDSLIKIAQILAPRNLPGLYEINSVLYEQYKDYPNALKHLKISHHIQDSLSSEDAHKQLNELQVKYDINSLNNEKTMLEIKNKKILVISLSILLIIVIAICTYLYFSLKKEKRMKMELKYLNLKAQESEKMKQAFINSICHEIRTPLNAIVGFSDLITNEEIDEEMRREFPAEIQKNTLLLTDLVNSMLEVANLDVSEEKLPCESTDLRNICIHAMDLISPRKNLEYRLDIPEESLTISTHSQYLMQVLEHLLSNANKFTETGYISLELKADEKKKLVYIYVTDTGCGIPLEKQEEVFNRFLKLDTFVPGNGLGLYLCRLIVKRLTGEIKIDSEYNEGTRVIVTLPIE